MTRTKSIRVQALTRVEGEGALHIDLQGNSVERVHLSIYEPPRFFEALLRDRPLEDVPDITARICGICPIAYQLTSIQALEAILDIDIPQHIELLRDLLYCGEWIESHAVHMHLLHIPDFFNLPSSIELAKIKPEEVTRGLFIKKIGNRLLEVIGGRAVHPINLAVGGFYSLPAKRDLIALQSELRQALTDAISLAHWVATFDYPEFNVSYEMLALWDNANYPVNRGEIKSTSGRLLSAVEFEQFSEEIHVAHSTALQSRTITGHESYLVGPLARLNLSHSFLQTYARELCERYFNVWPCNNPYRSLLARTIETVHALELAISLINRFVATNESLPRVSYRYRAGSGCWATEAPRGMIFHRYETDDRGRIKFAKIVPPTSQNQLQIENDLRQLLPVIASEADDIIAKEAERLVRCYDPCISCSTHALKVRITRR